MFIVPENIELNKLVKKRVLNFDTAKRLFGNLVIIADDSYDSYSKIFSSIVFKPQQMMAIYTPRRIKPMNRTYITYNQKDVYADIREYTNGFIKIGKALLPSYGGRNLAYNIIPEYTETYKLLSTIKNSIPAIHLYMQDYFSNLVKTITSTLNYEKSYVIFPIYKYIANLKHEIFINNSEEVAPFVEFLRTLKNGTYDKNNFSDISRIFFINPNANAMVVMDPADPDLIDNFQEYFYKINRLNNFNNNEDSLDDAAEEPEELSLEDEEETTKEQIKNIILTKVAKSLNARLDNYDEANDDEKTIINTISNKIDNYISSEDNKEKSFDDLVQTVEQDKDITSKAISYIETKKIAKKQFNQLEKNLAKEVEVVNSIPDIAEHIDKYVKPEKIKADIKMIDPRLTESSIDAIDKKYNNEQAAVDLVNNLTAFSEQDYLPITLDSFAKEDTSDEFTYKDTINVKYRTNENKTFTFKLDIPKVFDNHYIRVKGNTYIIQKQLCRLPIVKTKMDAVEINTNFNKITVTRTAGKVSRKNAYLKKLLELYKKNPAFTIVFANNYELNSNYANDFDYDELSMFLGVIKTMLYEINTDRSDVEKEFKILDYPDTFNIENGMTPVGFDTTENQKRLLFIKDSKIYRADINSTKTAVIATLVADDLYHFIVEKMMKEDPNKSITIGKSYMYSKCEFISVNFPVFVLIGLNIGLTSTLKKAKITYKVFADRQTHSADWIEIKFKNKYFYYLDTPNASMLLNVLYAMHTDDWDYEDFDTDAPFIDFSVNELGLPLYVKQTVKINISKLIDPITRDVLNYLKMPTDPFDLLILASNMLTNNTYISKNDLCNFRVRGNELIYATMYEIIAKAMLAYQNAKYNGSNKNIIKIQQNALLSALISQQNISLASKLNPILEIESSSFCGMKGFKGINLADAYTLEIRSYDKSMDGILSCNSTSYSGNIGIQRSLTVNPKLNNIRGFIPTVDEESLNATNRLSATELLSFRTAVSSDAPRIAMTVGQAKHSIPVYESNVQLIGSGYDRIIPYSISDNFCFKAKNDGYVKEIDEKNGIAILEYIDGSHDAIDLTETLSRNSSSGFFLNQKFTFNFKVNDKFKNGDVLAYNESFFHGDKNNCRYTPGTLAKVCLTTGDFVFEDSTYVSSKLSEKCAANITMDKAVSLGPNAVIHSMAKVGDEVKVNDTLLNFTTSFDDPTTAEFLQDLVATSGIKDASSIGTEKVLSKYTGRISDIEIYYNVPFETLHPTMQKIILEYNKVIENRKKVLIANNAPFKDINLKSIGQQKETKIKGNEFEGVLIIFYITHKDTLAIGDKLTYSVALKGIITKVSSVEKSPYSEFRDYEPIDGCSSAAGIPSRLTIDAYYQLYGNKLLVELGRWIHSEWNKN